MSDLKKKTFRLPELQKTILEDIDWKQYGFVNDSDFIRRCIDERLKEMGLLDIKKLNRPKGETTNV